MKISAWSCLSKIHFCNNNMVNDFEKENNKTGKTEYGTIAKKSEGRMKKKHEFTLTHGKTEPVCPNVESRIKLRLKTSGKGKRET